MSPLTCSVLYDMRRHDDLRSVHERFDRAVGWRCCRNRDIKPENVLYVSRDEDSEIKIIDFGLAMLENGPSVLRRSENLVGTPGFVSCSSCPRELICSNCSELSG